MRLLVHATGESDLLLDSRGVAPDLRPRLVQRRRQYLETLLDTDSTPQALASPLVEGAWPDGLRGTQPPIPLLSALRVATSDTSGVSDDLDVIVLGTHQDPAHPLDTLELAETLARVLRSGAADHPGRAPRHVETARVSGMDETSVIASLCRYLRNAPTYRQALVTWGSGPTSLPLGAMAALSQTGLPWQVVVTTTGSATPRLVDLLGELDADPAAGVLIRWRLFAALGELSSGPTPLLRLTTQQRELVQRAARRRDDGLSHGQPAGLLAALADTMVRRDGTLAMTTRRYITSEYTRLRAQEGPGPGGPETPDLLDHVAGNNAKLPLGPRLDRVRRGAAHDPVIASAVGLPSHTWLVSEVVDALLAIGNGSHRLIRPRGDYEVVTAHLSDEDVDGSGWSEAGLPVPPVAPADTVLAIWAVGLAGEAISREPVSRQLVRALPEAITDYLDLTPIRISALVFGTESVGDRQGSLPRAREEADALRREAHEAAVAPIEFSGGAPREVETAIGDLVTARTGALLVVPTGPKPALRVLLRAAYRVSARHGLPLFVRENADPSPDREAYTTVHQWPALVGGDLPLLHAARQALDSLELDVAWRLLAASAAGPELAARTRRLATAFACRQPEEPHRWPRSPDPEPPAEPAARARGMAGQRIALIHDALARAETRADRIRLLVLTADVLEASVAGLVTGNDHGREYREFRNQLLDGGEHPEHELVVTLLAWARNAAPISHPESTDGPNDPDEIVRSQSAALVKRRTLSPAEARALPQSLDSLLSQTIRAAVTCCGGDPEHTGDLRALHGALRSELDELIRVRGRAGHGRP